MNEKNMASKTREYAPADSPEGKAEAEQTKREFVKRFGTYAVTAPVAMYSLLSPHRSAVAASDAGPSA